MGVSNNLDDNLDDIKPLNKYVKDWLKDNKITQKEFANYMRTGQPQISRICKGKKLSFSFIKKLAYVMEEDEMFLAKMAFKANML